MARHLVLASVLPLLAGVALGAVPQWCQYVPAQHRGEACRGSSAGGCTCKDFCSKADPGSNVWNSECCGCAGVRPQAEGALLAELAPAVQLATVPAWCQFVPVAFQETACRGSNSSGAACSCAGWCANSTQDSWQWDPECCACGSMGQGNASAAPIVPEALLAAAPSVPAWCQLVPVQYQSQACRGSKASGCTCKDHCPKTDPGSMRWSSECCGCPGVAAMTLAVASPEAAGAPVPAWCHFVPAEFQSAACNSSSGACGCSDWCGNVTQDAWQWNPQCCGCGSGKLSQNTSAVTRSGSAAAPVAARPSLRGALAANQMLLAGRPAWCTYVPQQLQSAACRGSSAGGCSCKDFCAKSDKSSMQWDPECCGCSGVKLVETEPLLLPALQTEAVPSWCQYVPQAYQQTACRGSNAKGCTCNQATCAKIDRASWQWNPECCGCGTAASPSGGAAHTVAFLQQPQTMVAATVNASARPAWCQFVPQEQQGPACRGSTAGGCTCKDVCAKTDPGSMQWNTECCGCAGVKLSVDVPTTLLLPALQGAAVPSWCHYVPQQYQQAACRGSNAQGCTCNQATCTKSDRASWQWNPECCGCK